MRYRSPIRDLILDIDAAVAGHIAAPQVASFMNHVRDHLSAIARCEEINQHEAPCGECHIQPGERCDICGRFGERVTRR